MNAMMQISISCDADAKAAFEDFSREHNEEIASFRASQPNNLDGNTAAWIVIASLTVQAIPPLLTFLSDVLKSRRVERIKFGDIEIDHPTQDDIRVFRQMLQDRMKSASDNDEKTSA